MSKVRQEEVWLKVAEEIAKALSAVEEDYQPSPYSLRGGPTISPPIHTTTLDRKGQDVRELKVFISYSHKDEAFKDELVTMLAGLQGRGVVDAWQDRRIEAGDEWNTSIQDAMNDCDLALLLVSPDYLASRFIQEEEQPKLLERRQEMRLRVMPIIVRPCTWKSEPVLKDLQVLPKDGRAVITFAKDNGERDQVWADIATLIEERAKEKITP